ncbi:MAG TPA: NAD(P)-binding domain-containing protein [Anaerolineae bacterium]|nr:NAD(P)-binding domain-containing protein [Anaerolineae bacterium]
MTSNTQSTLLHKLNTHSATVAVIGLGYVGLPLAVAFAESGFPVVGIDVAPSKVDAINQSQLLHQRHPLRPAHTIDH